MTMNLYQVWTKEYDWCAYCIAGTRNLAKLRVAREFDCEYIDMRCETVCKGINSEIADVIDSEDHPMYYLVAECGHCYVDEDGEEVM